MFDLAWSEIALIGVVALVVIGPKDLPEAIRGVAKGVQKLRRMAAEFQTHADELVREAKLDEVRNQINEVRSAVSEIRNFDLRGEIEKNMDADGTLRKTFEDDPLKPTSSWSAPEPSIAAPPPVQADMPEAPAFIPPADAARTHFAAAPALPEPPPAPAFMPPEATPPPAEPMLAEQPVLPPEPALAEQPLPPAEPAMAKQPVPPATPDAAAAPGPSASEAAAPPRPLNEAQATPATEKA